MGGMRRLLVAAAVLIGVAAAVLVMSPAGTASADGGPHGGYTAEGGTGPSGGLPDQCGACHRVHQGKSEGKLLKASSPYALCLTCHNGQGSELDVWDGVKLAALAIVDPAVVQRDVTTNLTVSAAPAADTRVGQGGTSDFTVSIQNIENLSGTPMSVALGVANSNVTGDATGFNSGTIHAVTPTGASLTAFEGTNIGTATVMLETTHRAALGATYSFTAGTNADQVVLNGPTASQELTVADVLAGNTQRLKFDRLGHIVVRLDNSGGGGTVTGAALATGLIGRSFTTNASDVITSLRVPNPTSGGQVPGVNYFVVRETSNPGNATGVANLTTVTATDTAPAPGTSADAAVVLQAIVGTAPGAELNVLNGGGFEFLNGSATTSRHNADPADLSLRPWGLDANTGQELNTLSSPLQCTSCHNPHGTSNYRLLKETINGEAVNVKAWYEGVFVKDEGAPGLDDGHSSGAFAGVPRPGDKYVAEYYGGSGDGNATGGKGTIGLASLCGACHTAYPSDGASNPYTAGGTTHYRHKTEMPFTDWTNPDTLLTSQNPETDPIGTAGTGGLFPNLRLASNAGVDNATYSNNIVTCLTCHRVHGTNTTMEGYALKSSLGGSADEDLTPSQAPARDPLSTSTLLFTDNRGMCEACHQWGWDQGLNDWAQ